MASNENEILGSVSPVEKLNEIAAGRALNRRHFMAALGMTGAAAGAGLLSGCSTASTPVATTTTVNSAAQINALNFVLNLKYLEATFISYVIKGTDLSSSLTYDGGALTGTPTAALTFTAATGGANFAQTTDLLNEIYFDELSHLSALRSLLGSSVVARPAINLAPYGSVINASAGSPYNAIAIARMLKDLGVTALAGAAQLLTGSSLTFVAQILGTESFHAGALRLIEIQAGSSIIAWDKIDPTFDVAPYDPTTINMTPTTGTTNLNGTWTGPAPNSASMGGFFATQSTLTAAGTTAGMSFARTSSQVLANLYSSTLGTPALSGTTSGGFFPNGVTGVTNAV